MKSQTDVFINRELSWIEFNKRVLLTGMEKEYKILDKVKFCSIFSNNLDEFFMVRVASLKAQVESDMPENILKLLIESISIQKEYLFSCFIFSRWGRINYAHFKSTNIKEIRR